MVLLDANPGVAGSHQSTLTMLRSRFFFAVVLFVAGCRRDPSQLEETQRIAYAAKPAVVRISAYATGEFQYQAEAISAVETELLADGHELHARALEGDAGSVPTGAGGSGSGFVIHPDGYILTSGHVVAPTRDAGSLRRELRRNGAIAALVRHFPIETLRAIYREEDLDRYVTMIATGARLAQVRTVNQIELSNGETLPFTIVGYSPALSERGMDLALVRVARRGLPSLPLGDSETTRVGESIWSIGYPAVASSSDEVIGGWLSRDSDLEPTFNPGTITAIRTNVANAPVLQTNVAIYRGNSGGPAVNRRGEVVGVSTWGHTSAEQIKFLVPVNVAKQLLAESKIVPSIEGELNRRYRRALEAASEGRWVEAKRDLEVAAKLFPNSPDLLRFSRDVDRAIAAMPTWRLHPVRFLAMALAAMALVSYFLVRVGSRRDPVDVLRAGTVESLVSPEGVGTPRRSILGKFTILNGARAGERLGLGGSGIRIGRESTICEIVLENPKVSRLHAEVVSIDGRVMLIDRNSSNGTYVNDQKIDRRFLRDGDIIYFGGRNAVAVAFHE